MPQRPYRGTLVAQGVRTVRNPQAASSSKRDPA